MLVGEAAWADRRSDFVTKAIQGDTSEMKTLAVLDKHLDIALGLNR